MSNIQSPFIYDKDGLCAEFVPLGGGTAFEVSCFIGCFTLSICSSVPSFW